MDSTVTYAMRGGPRLIEVRLHPDFVDWAGQNYAVVAPADNRHPTRPGWTVIDRADLLGPWDQIPRTTPATT